METTTFSQSGARGRPRGRRPDPGLVTESIDSSVQEGREAPNSIAEGTIQATSLAMEPSPNQMQEEDQEVDQEEEDRT